MVVLQVNNSKYPIAKQFPLSDNSHHTLSDSEITCKKSNMKKVKLLYAIVLFMLIIGAEQLQAQVTYCAAWGKITYYEYIDYIAIGTIARTSGAEPGGYFDGTAYSTDVNKGSAYTLTYSHANPVGGYTENFNIFIDWNIDGDFSDAGENVLTATAYTTINYTTTINIPLTAATGSTRMRICMESALFGVPAACGKFQYGEVEDYTLHIIGDPVCTESFEPNNTKGTAKPIPVNAAVQSQISSATDVDWLSFSNTIAQPNIQILLADLPVNCTIKLYNPSGVLVGTSASPGLSNETIAFNTTLIGTYKIKVNGVAGAFSNIACYTLTANISNMPFKSADNLVEDNSGSLLIYPEPSVGPLTVAYEASSEGSGSIAIYSLQGERVYFENVYFNTGLNSFNINSALPSGSYILRLQHEQLMLTNRITIVQ